jgi:hypothetical protein
MWKTITTDTIVLRGGMSEIKFFSTDQEYSGQYIKEIKEEDIVEIIFSNQKYKELLLDEIISGGEHTIIRGLQRNKLLNDSRAGDFDTLIIENNQPEKIISLEFKSVYIEALDDDSDTMNKLNKMQKLIEQVNYRIECGIHKVYFILILKIDLSKRSSANVIIKNISQEIADKIWHDYIQKVGRLDFNPGIIFIKYSQPTKKSYKMLNNFSINIARFARRQEQSNLITNRMRNILNFK